jgi:hypothetical protein
MDIFVCLDETGPMLSSDFQEDHGIYGIYDVDVSTVGITAAPPPYLSIPDSDLSSKSMLWPLLNTSVRNQGIPWTITTR